MPETSAGSRRGSSSTDGGSAAGARRSTTSSAARRAGDCFNASGALYWLAGAVKWAVVAGSGNAWVLIVEIVRDAHYRPLDQEEQS
jgi:hypothetical protein